MPVYEDRQSAAKLIGELAKLPLENHFVVAVEDGSIREELLIDDFQSAGIDGEILYLRRNVGHQRAIAIGLLHLAENYPAASVVVMDSDGEDTPASVLELLNGLRAGSNHIVVAQRRRRSESLQFRSFYRIYKIAFGILSGRKIHFGNFVALSPRALRRLASMQETAVHFPGAIIASKLPAAPIPIDRGRRYFGRSKLNFVGLTLHGIRSMMVFAEDILVRVGLLCVAVTFISAILIVIAAIMKLAGYASPGWLTSVVGILLILVMQSGILMFVTLMMSGIIRGSASADRSDLRSLIDRIACTSNARPD